MSLSSIKNCRNVEEEYTYIEEKFKAGKFIEIVKKYPFKAHLFCKIKKLPDPDYSIVPSYSKYFSKSEVNHVSIFFVSHQIHIPPSMFGHTFLTFKNGKNISPFDPSLDFVGVIEDDLLFGFKAIFNSINGEYNLKHFIDKKNEYEQEHRDLWEYELSTSKEVVEEMKLFSLEIKQQTYLYNFLFNNCSDYVIKFLRVWPEISDDNKYLITIPIETIKVLNNNELLKEFRFHPSIHTYAISRINKLNDTENKLFSEIKQKIDNGERYIEPVSQNLEIAISRYLNFTIKNERNYFIRENAVELKKYYHAIDITDTPPAEQPLNGHPPFRFDLSYFHAPGNNSLLFGVRPFMHSVNDMLDGYQRYTSIEVLHAIFMYTPSDNRATLTNFTLINVDSFIPSDSLLDQFTRYINAGYQNEIYKVKEFSQLVYLKFGTGISYQLIEGLIFSLGLHIGAVDYLNNEDSTTGVMGSRSRIYLSHCNIFTVDFVFTFEYDKQREKYYNYSLDINTVINRNFSHFIILGIDDAGYSFSTGFRMYY